MLSFVYICRVNNQCRIELIIETEHVSIFSPKYKGEKENEFYKFLHSIQDITHPQLVAYRNAIVYEIEKITKRGAFERSFRLEGGRIKALPILVELNKRDKNIGKMRLYCIRYSDAILILGGGGVTTAMRYENDPCMLDAVNKLRAVDKAVIKELRKHGIDIEDTEEMKTILNDMEL